MTWRRFNGCLMVLGGVWLLASMAAWMHIPNGSRARLEWHEEVAVSVTIAAVFVASFVGLLLIAAIPITLITVGLVWLTKPQKRSA